MHLKHADLLFDSIDIQIVCMEQAWGSSLKQVKDEDDRVLKMRDFMYDRNYAPPYFIAKKLLAKLEKRYYLKKKKVI